MMVPAALMDAVRRNPYPLYRVARRFMPVIPLRNGKIWALFDHESVKRALNDPETFSSRAAPPGEGALEWLIFLDPPQHTRLRSLVSPAFTPRMVEAMEPRITTMAESLLAPALERGELELVSEFADRLPMLVIMEMLGVDASEEPRMKRWGDATLMLGDTLLGGERAERARQAFRSATAEVREYLADQIPSRRAAPRDDVLTRLTTTHADGSRLTDDEILLYFQLLLFAGTETTTGLIANTLVCLLDHPGQLARVREDHGLIPTVVEEVLRYRTPVQIVFRTTRRPVMLHGRTLPEGALVLAVVGSANRDPRQFRDAERFDVSRVKQPHVGFGHGIHYCIGAALARLEARVALSVLLSRATRIERMGTRAWPPRAGLNVHGPSRLSLRIVARQA